MHSDALMLSDYLVRVDLHYWGIKTNPSIYMQALIAVIHTRKYVTFHRGSCNYTANILLTITMCVCVCVCVCGGGGGGTPILVAVHKYISIL